MKISRIGRLISRVQQKTKTFMVQVGRICSSLPRIRPAACWPVSRRRSLKRSSWFQVTCIYQRFLCRRPSSSIIQAKFNNLQLAPKLDLQPSTKGSDLLKLWKTLNPGSNRSSSILTCNDSSRNVLLNHTILNNTSWACVCRSASCKQKFCDLSRWSRMRRSSFS